MSRLCEAFHAAETVEGANRLIASVRERYTTVKQLAISPPTDDDSTGSGLTEERSGVETTTTTTTVDSSRDLLVTVHFSGPQPSQRPGRLLRELLGADSVEAHPVELDRGRRKRQRFAEFPTPSDSSSSISGEHAYSICLRS